MVSRRARAARTASGLATAVAGALSTVSALTPDVPWRRHLLLAVEPGSAITLEHVLAALGGASLVYLGWGIVRARRRAADVAIAALLVLAVLNAAKGLDYEEAGVTLALAAALWLGRRACRVGGSASGAVLAATIAVGAIGLGYTVDVTTLLFSGHAGGFGAALTSAATTLRNGAWWLRSGEPSAIALDVLLVVTLAAAAAALRALLRPMPAADGHDAGEHRRAAAIVERYGRDSLDPFALREDKAFFFARDGFLAYRTLRETAVVSGDPVGPPEAAVGIVADFLVFAAGRGWDVVLTAVSAGLARDCSSLGLRALCIGEEAVVEPARFTLEGRAIRKVRQSVTRAERRGWSVEVVEGVGAETPLACELRAVEARWRSGRRRVHGFAMCLGRLWGAPEDDDAVYALGRAPGGELRAFVRFARCGPILSLDVIRRSGDEPNGLSEALVARTLEWARERGCEEVSLNFAGFAHVMASRATLSGRQRILRWLVDRAHGRFQLERLITFNEKFRPSWRPRFLVYGTRTHLPLAALRVLQAEAYVRAPATRAHPRAWRPQPHLADGALQLPPQEAIR